MSNLTSEQLAGLTAQVNERLAEFQLGNLGALAPGIVRVVVDVAAPMFISESKKQQEEIFEWRLREFKRGWDSAQGDMEEGGDGEDEWEGDRGGHRRFPSTTPEGRAFTINGDPNMDEETRHALGEMADAVYEHLSAQVEDAQATPNGHSPADADALAAAWPTMPDLPDGEDESGADDDDDLVDTIPTPLDGLSVVPQKCDEKSTDDAELCAEPDDQPQAQPHAAVFDLIRGLAAGGIMPRQLEYDEAKADDMPSSARLKQIVGLTWRQIAQELGLTVLAPVERAKMLREERATAAVATSERYAEKAAEQRRKFSEQVNEFIRSIAIDSQMPMEDEYNAKRPVGLPASRDMMARLGFGTWRELAEDLGLRWPPKPKQ